MDLKQSSIETRNKIDELYKKYFIEDVKPPKKLKLKEGNIKELLKMINELTAQGV
jgi:hypothetical protein